MFYHSPACKVECVLEYIFLFSKNKQTSKRKARVQREQKKLKKKREYIREIDQKKLNLRAPGLRFFSSPAFPETRIFFFGPSNSLGADYLFKNGEITALKELILEQKYFVKNSVENLKNQKNGFSNSPLFESLMEKIEQKIKEKLR